jgi:riboflavin kinase/FMN adenylyltransferase
MNPSVTRVNQPEEVTEKRPTFLAIGVFDGVHRGHQTLLQTMVAAAQAAGARPAVLTFFPHPTVVIQGTQGRLYLATLADRVALLAEQGLELIITHPFDDTVRQTRAADFIEHLCRTLDLRQLWGGQFALGYNREGTLPFLTNLGQEKGYTVHHFEQLVEWDGAPVSSSRVRRSLAAGNVADVTGCLGRPYHLCGEVVQGAQRGRTIGVPTANLSVWDELLLPANGVYSTYAWVGAERHVAATNIGVRPTVDGQRLSIEAHLLDFEGDLYGQEIKLEFIGRIRDEQKFPSLDALVAQIHADVAQVRQLLFSTLS